MIGCLLSMQPMVNNLFVKTFLFFVSIKILHPGLYIMSHDQGYVNFSLSQSSDYGPCQGEILNQLSSLPLATCVNWP